AGEIRVGRDVRQLARAAGADDRPLREVRAAQTEPAELHHALRLSRASKNSLRGTDPFDLGDPVGFPGLAAIGRESLFETCGGRRDVGPDEAHDDRFPFKLFLVVELAATVVEAAS